MFNLTGLKDFDLQRLDPTRIDLTRLDIRNLEMPKFDATRLTQLEVPAEITRAAELARDAAFAGVGALVVTAQKAEDRRRQLADQVTAQVRKLVETAR